MSHAPPRPATTSEPVAAAMAIAMRLALAEMALLALRSNHEAVVTAEAHARLVQLFPGLEGPSLNRAPPPKP